MFRCGFSGEMSYEEFVGFFCCQCRKYAGAWKRLEGFYDSKMELRAFKETAKLTDVIGESLKAILTSSKPIAKCSDENVDRALTKLNYNVSWDL